MADSLLNRRTVRQFRPDSVSDELLEYILSAGTRSSTTGNMQLYSIVITRSAEMKEKLSPLHFNQKMVKEAPLFLTFCADFNRFNKWCRLRNAEPGYDNFLSFVTAAIDAVIAAQTVAVAAESKGLGICYLGTVIYTADKIIDLLKLPSGVVPVAALAVGWPADLPPQPDRLPLSAVTHNEVYREYKDSEIDEIYAEKEARIDSLKFVEENGKETLAQVFTDVRYKKKDNIFFSEVLLGVLKKQGFMS